MLVKDILIGFVAGGALVLGLVILGVTLYIKAAMDHFS